MVDLIDEAVALQGFLDSNGRRFCFIGGVAVQNWGEPRLTRDIDVSLLTGFGGERSSVDLLLGAYPPRIEDAREFALAHRVLLVRSPGGIGIDVSLAALPYEELAIDRALLHRDPPRPIRRSQERSRIDGSVAPHPKLASLIDPGRDAGLERGWKNCRRKR